MTGPALDPVQRILAAFEAHALERTSDEAVATGPCARIAMHAQAATYRDCAVIVRHELARY